MSTLNETPNANRIRIAFFGLRNAGKSTLVNAFTGQEIAIVSDVPGTTTDPVSKAMEILPLGPCLITDTAGLDDEGSLGEMRVKKTLGVLATTDIAVWVGEGKTKEFADECARRNVAVIDFKRGESVEALKQKIAGIKTSDEPRPLLEGLVAPGMRVLCICPIDESAPKGRLILPQVQLLRECLDNHATAVICQPQEAEKELATGSFDFAVVDSQAFALVKSVFAESNVPLTSFSILFARQKGDLAQYAKGIEALGKLKDGDLVLVAEGCTHHRQCNDIGTVKLPKALRKLSGKDLKFEFASGASFLEGKSKPALIVQCGGCMLTRREVLRRIGLAKEEGVPIANYGMVLAAAGGMRLKSGSVFVDVK
ncbi:MAG: 50S ribosome-binding GTPase [Kiritimatiellae bacterium]|nr:50S ribosome-binding GTPase [Kiritimatiellia bacterium]